jgi:hypothetical protein
MVRMTELALATSVRAAADVERNRRLIGEYVSVPLSECPEHRGRV